MAVTEVFSGTTSAVGTTEYFLTTNSTTQTLQTTPGIYCMYLNIMNVGIGDVFLISVYEKVTSGDSPEQVMIDNFTGPVDSPHYVTPALAFLHGWDYSVRKIAGTDRTFTFSIRKLG